MGIRSKNKCTSVFQGAEKYSVQLLSNESVCDSRLASVQAAVMSVEQKHLGSLPVLESCLVEARLDVSQHPVATAGLDVPANASGVRAVGECCCKHSACGREEPLSATVAAF